MKKNSNIFDRIEQLAENKGFKNIPDLANYLGYSSAEKLYRLKRLVNATPSFDIIQDFTNKFEDLNLRWFVTGKGEMLTSGNEDSGKSKNIGAKNAHTPSTVNQISEEKPIKYSKKDRATYRPTDRPTRNFGAPQVVVTDVQGNENVVLVGATARAQAAYIEGYADSEYIGSLPSYRLPGLNNGSYRMFEVGGHSMNPTLSNRDIVIGQWVEKPEGIKDERIYVIVTKTKGIVVKRVLNRIDQYNGLIAKSDNHNKEDYPHLHIPEEEIQEIWYARMFMSADFSAPSDMYNRLSQVETDLFMLMKQLKEKGI